MMMSTTCIAHVPIVVVLYALELLGFLKLLFIGLDENPTTTAATTTTTTRTSTISVANIRPVPTFSNRANNIVDEQRRLFRRAPIVSKLMYLIQLISMKKNNNDKK